MNTTVTPTNPQPQMPVSRPRQRTAGHIVAIVAGALALLPSLGALGGGIAVLTAQAVATDDDGYFSMTLDRVDSTGVAITTDEQWFDDAKDEDAPWVLDVLDVDLRLRVDGAASTDDVFVGIARTPDVEAYLEGRGRSVVTEIDDHTPVVDVVTGSEIVASPLDQDFWVASTHGTAEQTLDWATRGGRWSVVVMNTDGTPGVTADVEVGAKSGAVTPIGVVLIVFGGIGTLVSVGLIVFGARGRKRPAAPLDPTFTSPLPPPAPQPAGDAAAIDPTTIDPTTADQADDRFPSPVG